MRSSRSPPARRASDCKTRYAGPGGPAENVAGPAPRSSEIRHDHFPRRRRHARPRSCDRERHNARAATRSSCGGSFSQGRHERELARRRRDDARHDAHAREDGNDEADGRSGPRLHDNDDPHHRSAVEMAKTELTRGKHPELKSLARAIIKSQDAEITQMHHWLQAWYR